MACAAGAGFIVEFCMRFIVTLAAFLSVILIAGASEARPLRASPRMAECNITMPCDFSAGPAGGGVMGAFAQDQRPMSRRMTRRMQRLQMAQASDQRPRTVEAEGRGRVIGGRPSGCPRAFCGCGASLRVFGRIVPQLNLAANWLRFPRTSPAPGMVAARRGHVFVLEQHVAGDTWMAYDANSGGRATRLHARSLRGFTVVNPHAA
jgi:hypothetical protein